MVERQEEIGIMAAFSHESGSVQRSAYSDQQRNRQRRRESRIDIRQWKDKSSVQRSAYGDQSAFGG